MKMNRALRLLPRSPWWTAGCLLLLVTGCRHPPVGVYETTSKDGVEYVVRPTGPLLMDIVEPVGAQTPRPAVLLLHPGGWAAGSRADMKELATFLASLGYTAATADYRLWPKCECYPAPVQDSLAAVKFLRSRAKDYGIDPEKIVIGGESAGGSLALLVGLAKDHSIFDDASFPGVSAHVSAVIDIYGPTDMPRVYKDGIWIVKRIGIGYLGAAPNEAPQKWKESSPVTHVHADAPPVLIIHGDKDVVVPYSQAELLAKRLAEVGVDYQLVRVPGGVHGWGSHFSRVENQRTLPVLVHFLAQSLGTVKAPPTVAGQPDLLQ